MANQRQSIVAFTGLLFFCAPQALAGPDWDEICDAGSTIGTAQVIPGGSVRSIRGRLSACPGVAGPGDTEDMYQFTIMVPSVFCARTVMLNDQVDCCGNAIMPHQGTNFNTQLWLFKANGLGLLANDDESASSTLSRIGNTATDGSGAMVINPGTYYLAISGGPGRDPISAGGLIFNQALLTEVSGPDGPGGGSPMIGWTGPGISGPGVIYEIFLCGSTAQIPATSTSWLLIMTGMILAGGAILIMRGRMTAAA